MTTPPYMLTLNPVRTPAEAAHTLELENTTLRMRVAVLTEALRAAEEELTNLRFGDHNCDAASGGVTIPHAVIQGVFNKREWPE